MVLPMSRSQIFAILEALKVEYPDEVTEWVASQMEGEGRQQRLCPHFIPRSKLITEKRF